MRDASSASPKAPLLPGTPLLGEYVVGRQIERGTLWTLYEARHGARATERYRLRVLNDDAAGREEVLAAFASRVERLALLAHPALVPIVAAGVDGGVALVVTRDLIGTTLRDRLARSGPRLNAAETARVITEIAAALDYLHAQQPQVVHGALDVSRVFLAAPSGSVRLLGLDDMRRPSGGATGHPSADQFALASIVFECLTLQAPFEGDEATALLRNKVAPALKLTGELASKRADLEWVLHRAWSPDPSRRFASAGRLASEVARLLVGSEVAAAPNASPPVVPASGNFLATRPTSPSGSRIPAVPTGPAVRATVPVTPPSGERPAVRPTAGRYAVQLATRSRPSIEAPPVARPKLPPLPSPSGERPAVSKPLVSPTRAMPPPLPAGLTSARQITTPTRVGAPVHPPPPPSLVADLEPVSDSLPAIDLTPLPEEAPRASAPAEPIALVSVSERVIGPIPLLVGKTHEDLAPAVADTQGPSARRRPLQLVAASLLAVAFGGERLAPYARRAFARVASRGVRHPGAAPVASMHTPVANTNTQNGPLAGDPDRASMSSLPGGNVADVGASVVAVHAAPRATVAQVVAARRPGDQDRAQAALAMHQVIDDCAAAGHREHRHARFAVTFEGATGAAVGVMFPDQFFQTHSIGTCIAEGARRVSVPAFSDRTWVGSYSIMVP